MSDLILVISVEKLFVVKTICETTDTYIHKRNLSNVANVVKAFVNLGP